MKRALAFILLAGAASADTSGPAWWTVHDDFATLRSCWVVKSGAWTIENGALVGRRGDSPDACGMIEYKTALKNPTELELDAQLMEPIGGNAGLQVQFAGQKFFHYVSGSGIWPPYVHSPTGLKKDGVVHIRLRRLKGKYEFWVDGKLILNRTVETAQEQPSGELKIWSAYGAVVKFDNLKAR